MMEDTLVEMSDILNEKNYCWSARVLYTETADPSFLVIDDLASMGYRMAHRWAGLDVPYCILAIRRFAKFHASSVALFEKEPNQKLAYTRGIFHEENPKILKKLFTDGMRIICTEVANWPELGSSATTSSENPLKLSEVCYQRATECIKLKVKFNMINHGDFCVNNILVRYNKESNVTGSLSNVLVEFASYRYFTLPQHECLGRHLRASPCGSYQ